MFIRYGGARWEKAASRRGQGGIQELMLSRKFFGKIVLVC